jgi:hypothetical protein
MEVLTTDCAKYDPPEGGSFNARTDLTLLTLVEPTSWSTSLRGIRSRLDRVINTVPRSKQTDYTASVFRKWGDTSTQMQICTGTFGSRKIKKIRNQDIRNWFQINLREAKPPRWRGTQGDPCSLVEPNEFFQRTSVEKTVPYV